MRAESTSVGLADDVTQASEVIGPSAILKTRRRNRPLAAWRKTRAVELATQGFTYDAIAQEVGYADRGTAHRVVKRALAQSAVDAVDAHRKLEQDRLDALQLAVWTRAMSGDPVAVQSALKIIEARARLLGLNGETAFTGEAKEEFASVVLTSTE